MLLRDAFTTDFVENNRYETYCKQNNSIIVIDVWSSQYLFLMNNGGEFANDEMQELSNQYGICIKQAVAYSPWRMD